MTRFGRLLRLVICGVAVVLACAACADADPPTRAGLPENFPAAQVPLIDGTVLRADGDSQQWIVTVQAGAGSGNPLDAAVRALTAAGYAETGRTRTDGQRTVTLWATKDATRYVVTVGVTTGAAGGGQSVFYQVSSG
ncbi:MAG: hypothetical protein QM662_16945 [Gordonia sp. (in: high G+C Gram-positive bacteria)]